MMCMTELQPAEKIEDCIAAIARYHPQITQKDADFLEAKLVSPFGEELWIVIDTEFSIFFGDWHAHYFAYEDEYRLFLDDLFGILESRRFTVCAYRGVQWCGSTLSHHETPDESELRKEYGEDKIIKCNYWNQSKNVVFEPGETNILRNLV